MKFAQILCVGTLMFWAAQECSMAQVNSPCGIPAYPSPLVPTALSALMPPTGQPVILFNPAFFNNMGGIGGPLFRWMLAHECRHHLNGDVIADQINPQGMLMITPEIELRADCGSAQYLKSVGDLQALQVAIQFWARSGNAPTGPNYPTGNQRAQALMQCGQ